MRDDSVLGPSVLGELLRGVRSGSVLVVGGGVTGRGAIQLLKDAGVRTIGLVDEKELSTEFKAAHPNVEYFDRFTAAPAQLQAIKRLNPVLAIVSPGIAPRSVLANAMRECGAVLVSELDFALPFLGMPEVAVTGTNGKTTTVHLIAEMIARGGREVALVGNVGTPFMSLVPPDAVRAVVEGGALQKIERTAIHVAELSSYQLETVKRFRPRVAILLNVDDDHLERHGSLDEYTRVKTKIFAEQSGVNNWALVNLDEGWSRAVSATSKGRVLPFGRFTAERAALPVGSFYEAAGDFVHLSIDGEHELLCVTNSPLRGDHNRQNIAAAAAAARILEIPLVAIQAAIDGFAPLEHRVEFVREVNGIRFVNDSKGTNVSAVVVALGLMATDYPPPPQSLTRSSKAHVRLLLGGKIKEGNWGPIRAMLSGLVRQVVVFGGDRELVLERLGLHEGRSSEQGRGGSFYEVVKVPLLSDAVNVAYETAEPGDVILLSPGCASFDAYSDYTARGRHFRELAQALEPTIST